jgi:thiol-disulfide isomerase/thioredoxin
MFSRASWSILALAVLAAAAGGYLQHRSSPAATSLAAGAALPDIVLPDLDGKPHRLADYRGRRVLLNFWASWCGPCLEEMPALSNTHRKFGERGSIVIGIAMDDAHRVRSFLAAHPQDYPMLLGQLLPPSTSLQLGDTLQVLPYSVLLDSKGHVLATHAGALSANQLDQWLAPPMATP